MAIRTAAEADNMKTADTVRQVLLTPAAGKRLIAKGLAIHPSIRRVLKSGTLVIIAGTTNGYVAEEILASLGADVDFTRRHFIRGINVPPQRTTTETGRLPDESGFPGDVVLIKGVWMKGKTILEVVDQLKEGDVIVKGANALDVEHRRAAILIGHPQSGTIGAALPVIAGRRVELILAVGLEKRVPGDLDRLAARVNAPGAHGLRLLPVPGLVFTELDAVELLTGAKADIVVAGGVYGAEGCIWLTISVPADQTDRAARLLTEIASEQAFGT